MILNGFVNKSCHFDFAGIKKEKLDGYTFNEVEPEVVMATIIDLMKTAIVTTTHVNKTDLDEALAHISKVSEKMMREQFDYLLSKDTKKYPYV